MGLFFKTPEEKATALQNELKQARTELQVLSKSYAAQIAMGKLAVAQETAKKIESLSAKIKKLAAKVVAFTGKVTASKKRAAKA